MRLSRLLVPTTKETPNDAVLPSHIYLLRGGFIQNAGGSGLYNFLPLGKRVLDRVRNVIKEELDKAGCQEVSLAFVTPAILWLESGRYEKYGKELLRFKDRKENEFVLGPTHEEMMVNLVRQSVKSYKQLPLNLYQINLKFRDEIRPRFGLMRGREFLMKDGYSFHVDEADMKREFALMEETYKKIFTRLGLDFRVVEADSGAIGGTGSKEFMVLADSGEDTLVVCDGCDYGANIEAAVRAPKHCEAPVPAYEAAEVETPDMSAIEEVAKFLKVDPHYVVKTVAMRALYDEGKSEIVLFALRGDDTLQEVKATNAVDANALEEIDEAALEAAGLVPGYMSPFQTNESVRVVWDNALKDAYGMVCGADKAGYHRVGVDLRGREATFADLSEVQEGDRCSRCGGKLHYTKGIEVGHIFQLGTRYSEPLGCNFLDENGKSRPMVMGTYGIGVSRLLAAIIEQHHDDRGCIWTSASAPFDAVVVVSNAKEKAQVEAAESLYDTLKKKGYDVLLDDRKDRFGSKMKDFELIGIPYAIIVGKKLGEGLVEVVKRDSLERSDISPEDLIEETERYLCLS